MLRSTSLCFRRSAILPTLRRGFQTSLAPQTVVVRHSIPTSSKTAYSPSTPVDWTEEVKSLSEEQKSEIAQLRNENPFVWSLSTLSQKYQISRRAVGAVAKLNGDNRERVISANIYKMNPSSNWKGPVHYRKVRNIQREREEYDAQREKRKRSTEALENAKSKATLV